MNNCIYCDKIFATIYNLKHHQKTAKFCLIKRINEEKEKEKEKEEKKIEEDEKDIEEKENKCEYCNKKFTTKTNLRTHYISCKNKKEKEEMNRIEQKYKDEIILYKKEIEKYKEEIEEYKEEIYKVEQKYKEEIEEYKDEISEYKEELADYRKTLLSNNEKLTQEVLNRSGSTVVNNTTQQHINNYHAEYNRMLGELTPFSNTYLKNKIKEITPGQLIYVHNLDNANSNNLIDYNFACNLVNILKNNVFFTDSARGKLVYKDEDNNSKRDMVEKFVLECVKTCKDECLQLCKTCLEIVRERENEFTYEDYGKCITGLAQLSDCIKVGKPHAIVTEIANKLVKHSSCLPSVKEFKYMLEQSAKSIKEK